MILSERVERAVSHDETTTQDSQANAATRCFIETLDGCE